MKKTIIILLTIFIIVVSAVTQSYAEIIPVLRKTTPSISWTNAVSGTISVCALRVAFQSDDNDATTGIGRFLTQAVELPCEDENFPAIDPAPHTNAYFRDHLRALSNYYNHASSGHLIVDTTNSAVFPLDDNSVYTLSRKMEYYHPFLKIDSIDVRLTELLVEAIQLADNDNDIDFSQYDVVVVFHAGVGQDFAIDLDPTPYDIPSAYLNSNDIADYFSSINESGSSIIVDGGTEITQGIILPESQNHLLYDNWEDIFGGATTPCDYQIGLNGTFAFMMGFYLGLPGLYNTETGETGVGKFGLMDQGSANLNGLVPSFPSAWERYYMGWDQPIRIDGFEDVRLQHAESGSDTTLWLIPIDDDEYFLVENRYSHVHPGITLDSIQYKQYLDNGEKDWPPMIPLIVSEIGAEFSSETGVLLSVLRYDVGLPGSGLLIWHIDESVINANLATNSINNDRDHRGVDLEEGDGAQDLGYESQIIGANVDVGWYFDPWFAGNEGFWDLNPEYPEDDEKRVGFTNSTNPSSRSYNWAYTGIVVDSIGPSEAVMSFRIEFDYLLEDFNVDNNIQTGSHLSLLSVDFNNSDPTRELLAISNQLPAIYYSFNEAGTQLVSDVKNALDLPAIIEISGINYFICFQNYSAADTMDIFEYSISETGELSINNFRQIPGNRVLSNRLSYNDRMLFCTMDDQTDDYYLIAYYPEDNSTSINQIDFPVYRIVSDGNLIYSDSPNNAIMTINPETLETNLLITNLGIGIQIMGFANINNNQIPDLIVVYSDLISLVMDIQDETQEILTFGGEFDSTLAFPDIDGDGKVEIIVKNAMEIYALNENLTLENNFPISVPNIYIGKKFLPNVLTTDVDGDQILDVIVTLEDVGILTYNFHGDLIDGFPRALPNSVTEQSVLMENEKGTFIVTSNITGTEIIGLYLTNDPLSENAWYCFGGDVEHSFYYPVISHTTAVTTDNLINKTKTFNWPNPAKNNRTAIRYFPLADCDIDITIYDLAGNFIKSFTDSSPLINDYNEIEWDVSNIANGVYFAVVKASAGSKSENKIVKIMVIH
ncbi:MAG: T9SS type A sorting domain-containing protein [Candidatus Marinimicrobia bacterium]|nr:T9SS type A sorting domain-containing protein [Candidatus Neomarinimicrobiota bacterium]